MGGFDFNKRPDERRIVKFGDGRAVAFNEDEASREEIIVSHWYAWGVFALIGAPSLAIAGVSGVFNALFAWSLGSGTLEKAAWVAASIVFTTFVVGLPAAIALIENTDPAMTRIGKRLWYGCVAFSMISAMGFMAASGDHRGAVAGSGIEARNALKARIQANEQRLADIGRHRAADVVEADIKALPIDADIFRRSRKCTDITREESRAACQPLLRLQKEWQEARAAEALEGGIRADRERLNAMPVTGNETNAQTALFEWLTGGIVPAHVFDRLLAIFITLLIECGSAFGLAITASVASAAMLHRRRAFARREPDEPEAELHVLPAGGASHAIDRDGAARLWLQRAVGHAAGARVKAADAYGFYQEWLEANGFHGQALPKSSLGKLLSDFTVQMGGRVSHSNGTVYEGIAIAQPLRLTQAAAE